MPYIRAICQPKTQESKDYMGWTFAKHELTQASARAQPMTNFVGKPVFLEHDQSKVVGKVTGLCLNSQGGVCCDIFYDDTTDLGKQVKEGMISRKYKDVSMSFDANYNKMFAAKNLKPFEISIVEQGALTGSNIMHFDISPDESGNRTLYYVKPVMDMFANSIKVQNSSQKKQMQTIPLQENVPPVMTAPGTRQHPDFAQIQEKYPDLTVEEFDHIMEERKKAAAAHKAQMKQYVEDPEKGIAKTFKNFVAKNKYEQAELSKLGAVIDEEVYNKDNEKFNVAIKALFTATSNHAELEALYLKNLEETAKMQTELTELKSKKRPADALDDPAARKQQKESAISHVSKLFSMDDSNEVLVQNSAKTNGGVRELFEYNESEIKKAAASLPLVKL